MILDASFSRRAGRAEARRLADSLGARLVVVECRLDDAAVLQRLRARSAAGPSVSDGREELFPRQKRAFEPITELPPAMHLVVETDRPPEALAAELLPRLELPAPLFGDES